MSDTIESLRAELERKSEAIQKLWRERDEARAEAEALRADAERLTRAARESLIDAACFRFWVREAAQAPGDMAKLIANCTTEDEYRAAIMPCIVHGGAAIDSARSAKE